MLLKVQSVNVTDLLFVVYLQNSKLRTRPKTKIICITKTKLNLKWLDLNWLELKWIAERKYICLWLHGPIRIWFRTISLTDNRLLVRNPNRPTADVFCWRWRKAKLSYLDILNNVSQQYPARAVLTCFCSCRWVKPSVLYITRAL